MNIKVIIPIIFVVSILMILLLPAAGATMTDRLVSCALDVVLFTPTTTLYMRG